jgi:hypothetical protein
MTGKEPKLPKRSAVAPAVLARRTCLRCSKRIAINPDFQCKFKGYKKMQSLLSQAQALSGSKCILAMISPH